MTNALYRANHQLYLTVSCIFLRRLARPTAFTCTVLNKSSQFYPYHKHRNQLYRSKPPHANSRFAFDGYCINAFGKRLTDPYDGLSGFIISRRCGEIAHPSHWEAHNLKHVVRSSSTAKLLVAVKTVEVML